jgi:transcription elongation GreA/GreB family factor
MNDEHNQIDNADIRVLRSQRAELQQAQSKTNEDIQAGDEAQRQDGRIQHHRLTHQLQAVEDQIEEMNSLLSDGPGSQDGTISIGHVVTIRIDGGETKTYVLVNERGGQELSGKTTLSSQTPVGNTLIGRHGGETVSVGVGEERITIEIMDVGVLI